MGEKTYRLNFGMSDGTVKNVDFTVPYDDSKEIPEYWQTALDNGVNAICEAVENAGREKSAFLWYTDAHWGHNRAMSPKLLKYLQEHTAMNKVNFGGDIANDYKYNAELTDDEWMALMRQWRLAVRDLPNHHSVIGNHDDDGTVAHLADQNHLYGFLMAPEETSDIVRGGDFYYYIDEPSEKTRYLYLNTSFCTSLSASGEDAQGQFVVDALSTTPDGWHIIVISHIWFLYSSTNTPTQGDIPNYCKALLNLFDCYNSRTSGSIAIGTETITFDYTNGGASVAFCIGGHTHVDHDFTSDGGIPVILTETDSFHTRGDNTATSGTSTETAVYAIVADHGNHNIHVICVGRGLTREVQIIHDDSVQDYTNVLDEVGYTENMYVSASSGYAEKTKEGVDLTGYIPVQHGNIVYLKNVTMPDADDYTNKVYFYNSAKTGVNAFGVKSTATSLNPVFSGGNLVQFTILGSHLGWDGGAEENVTGYIRIGAANIDSTSVITVNEEID